MAHRICPWWLGYWLVCPIRRIWQDPLAIAAPFVQEGMTVLEPGCGMGFFTIDLARLVGPRGKVVAVDLQERMLNGLRKRASKANVLDRIDVRVGSADVLLTGDQPNGVDFIFAFAVVHEMSDAAAFFRNAREVLRPKGRILFAEPRAHVSEKGFEGSLAAAKVHGFTIAEPLKIRSARAVLLER